MKYSVWALRIFVMLAAAAAAATVRPANADPPATSSAGALLPVTVDRVQGRILLTLPAPDSGGVYARFLYATAAQTGMGSAGIRLDRGMDGDTQLLAFRRMGAKIAITFENPRFRAVGGTPEEEKGVADSFAFTTAWMTPAVSTRPDGSVVIDIAPFLTEDVMHLAALLDEGGGKPFQWVQALSAPDLHAVQAFPDNIEFSAVQTFESSSPGKEVKEIAPDPDKVSFVVHESLIKLPPPGYTPRVFDIRAGGEPILFYDYNAPLGAPIVREYATRFRLEKIHPDAARSRVKKPLVYYIDNAAPEPVREALKEGVSWWARAFDAAGFIDAFQVKILPKGASPLDVRYNVVTWDSRLFRSWSYGQRIVDPRTGEIVRGAVVLGALRTRQDVRVFHGLVGVRQDNSGGPNDAVRVALARLRQLGAHEVGHTLGFSHNFEASNQGRTSVMDYPGPRILLKDGKIDLSQAYATGIGSWDEFTVNWLYGEPPPGVDANQYASAKADAMVAAGTRYITDIDSRAPDSPAPWASMWDDGVDPVAELSHMMAVRRVALANFGPDVLTPDDPLADLRREFVPIWLLHRYQVVAAAKVLGGVDYNYAIAGHSHPQAVPVPAVEQEAAIKALMETLSARELTVPTRLLGELSYGIHGEDDLQFDAEVFANAGAAVFDPLVATDVGAQVTLDALLAPSRLTRVYEQHLSDPSLPGLDDLLDRLLTATVSAEQDAIGRRIAYRTIMTLARTVRDADTSPDVAAAIEDRLRRLADTFAQTSGDGDDAAWKRSMAHLLRDESLLKLELGKRVPPVPPGMPI
jgi:hypothetical protein